VLRLYLLFFYLLVCYNTRGMPCLTKKNTIMTFLKRSGYLQSSTDCITRRQRPDMCLMNDTTAKVNCCNIPASIFRERRLMNNPNQTSHVKHVNGARDFVFNWDRIRKYFNLFVTKQNKDVQISLLSINVAYYYRITQILSTTVVIS